MPSEYDPIPDEIQRINAVADAALAEAWKSGVPPQHQCGARGYGVEPWDRCAGCEYEAALRKLPGSAVSSDVGGSL
jgi:hypothetical protein